MNSTLETVLVYLVINFMIIIGSFVIGVLTLIAGVSAIAFSPVISWLWIRKVKLPLKRIKSNGKN